MAAVFGENWAPDVKEENLPTRTCIKRIHADLQRLEREQFESVLFCPDETLNTVVHAVLIGPSGTPYEKAFFYVACRVPPDYPVSPPKVMMRTGGVRLNPNLYANGKVCLSILHTWPGPGWSPVHCLSTMLLSIQSLLTEKPLHNEPGYEEVANGAAVDGYNNYLRHEVLRLAVCDTMEKILDSDDRERRGTATGNPIGEGGVSPCPDLSFCSCSYSDSSSPSSSPSQNDLFSHYWTISGIPPRSLHVSIKRHFLTYLPDYLEWCDQRKHMNGRILQDMFGTRIKAEYDQMRRRLTTIFDRINRTAPSPPPTQGGQENTFQAEGSADNPISL